jgi:hypothetical protein
MSATGSERHHINSDGLEVVIRSPCALPEYWRNWNSVRRKRDHVLADARRRNVGKMFLFAAYFVIEAQRRAEQTFAERLQHDHVLPVSHDEARKRHALRLAWRRV